MPVSNERLREIRASQKHLSVYVDREEYAPLIDFLIELGPHRSAWMRASLLKSMNECEILGYLGADAVSFLEKGIAVPSPLPPF